MEKIKQIFASFTGRQKRIAAFFVFLVLYLALLLILPPTIVMTFLLCVAGWQIGGWVAVLLKNIIPD